MRAVYAVQFHIVTDGRDESEVFVDVQDRISAWLTDSVKRRIGQDQEFESKGEWNLDGDASVTNEVMGNPESSCIASSKYVHPDDRGAGIWESNITLAKHGGAIEFAMTLRAGAEKYRVAPLRPPTGRPRVVAEIVGDMKCTVGGQVLRAEPKKIGADEINEFVEDDILSTTRRLPIVVVTPEQSGGYLVDSEYLADRLAGSATVAVIEEPGDTYAFTRLITRPLTCFNGAVRIYWPGVKLADNPYSHPLFLPERLNEWAGRKPPAEVRIASKVIDVAAFQHVDGVVAQTVRRAMREKALEAIRKSTKRKSRAETLDAQVAALEDEVRSRDSIIETLEEQNKELEGRFWQWTKEQRREDVDAAGEPPETPSREKPSTVAEAVKRASEDFPDTLWVWDSAIRASEDSTASFPDKVYEAFEALSEVGRMYFDANRRGEGLGQPLRDIFRSRYTLDYKSQESQSTGSGRLGELRRFTEGERSLQFERHLTLGGGSREDCVQVYFEFDEESERVMIGYCGPHLDYASSRT